MRIGILGGTFNPIHNGHLRLAEHALEKMHLDKVIFVPTHMPPHKEIHGNTTVKDRVCMLRLALRGKKRFGISLYEIKKKGKSYSIETVRYFKKRYGSKAKLFFLIGADSLKGLVGWKNIAALFKLVQFVVFPRSGFKMKKKPAGILAINIPKRDISSTEVRHHLAKKESLPGHFVPREVFRYIEKKKLYRGC